MWYQLRNFSRCACWLTWNVHFTLNRSTAKLLFGEDYHDKFDTQAYLQADWPGDPLVFRLFLLKQLHILYQSQNSTEEQLKILDVGTGPVIAHTISAAPYASEIVLSEYTEANRKALLQWLKNDPNSYNWFPYFKHVVVDLEGKGEEEVPVRMELVRKVIKAVVPCDVNSDPPIPAEYVDEYDIVTSFLCLICACATEDDYVAALVRLCALLKPGGTIALYSIEWKPSAPTPASYPVGSQKFFDLLLSREFVSKSLEQAGFSDVNVLPLTDHGLQDQFPEISAFSFYTARKMI